MRETPQHVRRSGSKNAIGFRKFFFFSHLFYSSAIAVHVINVCIWMFSLFLFALAKITHPNVDDDTCRRLSAAWSIWLCFIATVDESLWRGLATIESESSIVVGRLIPKFIELIVLLLPISLRLNSKSFTQTDLVMFPEKNLKNLVNAEKNERE